MERWKDIEGYEGLYSISDHGRVKSSITNKILSPIDNGTGHFKVMLSKNKSHERRYIHRMVAKAFIPNPLNKSEVNHKDGNPSNNHISNLEWVSSSENRKHAVYTHALNAWGNPARPVEATNIESGTIIRFATISEAERAIGSKHITDVLKGKRNHRKGYVFKYIEGGDACANFDYRTT